MKIRQGFVSNSSSSSFIVSFDKRPETVEEMQNILFGDEEYYDDPYYAESYLTSQVAETVFNDLKEDTATYEEVRKQMSEHDEVKYDWSRNDDKYWERIQAQQDFITDKNTQKFLKHNKDKFVAIFEYGDNDGQYYSALEHGDLFKNVQYRSFSHH